MPPRPGNDGPPATGRVIGLDLGDARIGVAVSDPDRRLAVAVGTVHVGQPPGELKAIVAIAHDYAAELVVVGLPLSMSGQHGPRAQQAVGFVESLRGFLDVPVVFQDERLSTVEAERGLREAGVKGPERRQLVDRSAAVVILQAWLDANP